MANLSRRDAGKVLLASYAGLLVGREALGATAPLALSNAIPQDAVRKPQTVPQTIRGPQAAADSTWSDVLLVEGDTPTISYRTNWVVYEESFMNGQLVVEAGMAPALLTSMMAGSIRASTLR